VLDAPTLPRAVEHGELERVDAGVGLERAEVGLRAIRLQRRLDLRFDLAGDDLAPPVHQRVRDRELSVRIERPIDLAGEDDLELVLLRVAERIGRDLDADLGRQEGGAQRLGEDFLVGLPANRIDGELGARADLDVSAARNGDLDLVRLAVAICSLGCEAQEVIAGELDCHAIEHRVGIVVDAENGAFRQSRQPAEAFLREIDVCGTAR
jgi:hypothetical protein